MIRFIHTADWHVLDIQYGRTFRGQDFRKAVNQVVDFAISSSVDFLVFSGDILDKNRPSGDMLDFLFYVDQRLRKAEIPMYSITGNHDASEPSFLTLPGYDRKPGAGGIRCIDWETVVHKSIRISGFPACPWAQVEESVRSMSEPPDILLWHGAIKEYMPWNTELTLERVFQTPFRAALLGDIHVHEQTRGPEGRLLTYPGSVEIKARDETAEKFFDVYGLPEDWRSRPFPDPVAVPIETRPVLFLRADSEERAADCVDKVRQVVANSGEDRDPMIFLSYNSEHRSVISRIMSSVDRTSTIFRWKPLSTGFGGALYEKQDREMGAKAVRPKLLNVVDQVVHAKSHLNALARELTDPEINARERLAQFVDSGLSGVQVNSENSDDSKKD